MTELVALYDAHSTEAAEQSGKAKKKKELEEKAGKELRDASMKGLIPREELIDIAALKDATIYEKQGQCIEK